jgi:hypothetical protein
MGHSSSVNIPNLLGLLVKSVLKGLLALIAISLSIVGWISNQIAKLIQKLISNGHQ